MTTSLSRLTASKLSLARKCSYAFGDGRDWPERDSTEASTGRQFHTLCEQRLKGLSPTLPGVDAEALRIWDACRHFVDELARTAGDRAGRGSAQPEVAYAVTPSLECVEIPRGTHRDYSSAPEGSICGTADVVRTLSDRVIVDDWKTGRGPSGSLAYNDQLRFLAFAAAGVAGVTRATIRLLRCSPEGVKVESCDLDALDLEDVGEELRQLLSEARKHIATPRPGNHCSDKFCPMVGVCPAAVEATGEAEAAGNGGMIPAEQLTIAIRDATHAASVLPRLKLAKQGCKAVETALKAHVDAHGPVPLPSGKLYGKQMRVRKPSTRTIKGGEYAVYCEFRP